MVICPWWVISGSHDVESWFYYQRLESKKFEFVTIEAAVSVVWKKAHSFPISYPFSTTWLSKTLSVYKNAYTYIHKTTYLHMQTPSNLINQTKPRDIHSAFIWEDRKEKSNYLLLRRTRTKDFFLFFSLFFFLHFSLTILSRATPALFFFYFLGDLFLWLCLFCSLVLSRAPQAGQEATVDQIFTYTSVV